VVTEIKKGCWQSMKISIRASIFFIVLFLLPLCQAFADTETIPLLIAKEAHGGMSYSISIKIIAVMTLLTVLPALLMTMSAFTRIIIVLAIVRQAIGIPNIPNNQILIGLSLIMTLFVMAPIIGKINDVGVQPYLHGKINEETAFDVSGEVLKTFLLKQTRKTDLRIFADLSKTKFDKANNSSMLILMPAFITSELKTAFEIGFLVLLPFLIIDLVVASILMSMGMMMLSPMVISLPFKILFFVLVDGWSLIVTSLITSFRI
jgi:flagellar biosynthesis protein FliP